MPNTPSSSPTDTTNQQLLGMLSQVRQHKQQFKYGWQRFNGTQKVMLVFGGLLLVLLGLYSVKVMIGSHMQRLTQEARLLHEENLNLEVTLTELTSIHNLEKALPRLHGLVEADEKWQLRQQTEDANQPLLQGTAPLQRGTVYRFAQAW